MDDIKSVVIKTRNEWRDWLEKNHKKEKSVKLISYKKHTGVSSISHRESMEEAICFGWIDTTIKKINEETYCRTFVRRNSNSRWSSATLGYAKDLIKRKLMSEEGLKFYKEGLKKPTIDHGLSKNPDIPEDLKKELEKNNALENFNKFAFSYRRTYIYWVERAKRKETRDKRIKEVVKRAIENKKNFM